MATRPETYSSLPWLMPPPADFTDRCRAITRETPEPGLRIQALALHALDGNQLFRLAKVIATLQRGGISLAPMIPYRLGLASNGTTDLVVPSLVATAARYGISLECVATGFNQAAQEVLSAESKLRLCARI
jgi:hypothetical protein